MFKSELLIINLLQSADKYLIHLRKLKHLKNEAVKANVAAAKASFAKENATNANLNPTAPISTGTAQAPPSNETKSKTPNSKFQPDAREVEEANELLGCNYRFYYKHDKILDLIIRLNHKLAPSQTETVKEEDLLANIAYKLVKLMDSKIQVLKLKKKRS
jgi:hypothetical protein